MCKRSSEKADGGVCVVRMEHTAIFNKNSGWRTGGLPHKRFVVWAMSLTSTSPSVCRGSSLLLVALPQAET